MTWRLTCLRSKHIIVLGKSIHSLSVANSWRARPRSLQIIRLQVLVKIGPLFIAKHLLYPLFVVQIALCFFLLLKVWPIVPHRNTVRVERQYLQLFVLICARFLRWKFCFVKQRLVLFFTELRFGTVNFRFWYLAQLLQQVVYVCAKQVSYRLQRLPLDFCVLVLAVQLFYNLLHFRKQNIQLDLRLLRFRF